LLSNFACFQSNRFDTSYFHIYILPSVNNFENENEFNLICKNGKISDLSCLENSCRAEAGFGLYADIEG